MHFSEDLALRRVRGRSQGAQWKPESGSDQRGPSHTATQRTSGPRRRFSRKLWKLEYPCKPEILHPDVDKVPEFCVMRGGGRTDLPEHTVTGTRTEKRRRVDKGKQGVESMRESIRSGVLRQVAMVEEEKKESEF